MNTEQKITPNPEYKSKSKDKVMAQLMDTEVATFEDALELVQSSPTLREIKSYIDKTNLSADVKALLYDIAKFTYKVGEKVIAIGRYVFAWASEMAKKFPNLVLATIIALIIAALLSSTLGAITIMGKAIFAGLSALLSKLIVAAGITKGFLDDLRENAAKNEITKISSHFDALNLGVAIK
ncbi:MAG: hypothetical protein HOM91_02635 [Tateyamaria sp.]|jgi:hypothetical protein|nr:hypothetical protein [Tateyamaria sp.]